MIDNFFFAQSQIEAVDANELIKLEQYQQIQQKLEMYLGTFNTPNIKTPYINAQHKLTYKFEQQQEASLQLFYEIIQNALDNYQRTKNQKDYTITIDIAPRTFTIKNTGRVFDKLADIKKAFNNLNTSSHYTQSGQNEASAGTNGLGAKLVCMTQNTVYIKNKFGDKLIELMWKQGKLIQEKESTDTTTESNYFSMFVELMKPNTTFTADKNVSRTYTFADLSINQLKFYAYHIPLLQIKCIFNNTELPTLDLPTFYNAKSFIKIQLEPKLILYILYQSNLDKNYTLINGIYCRDSSAFQDIRDQLKSICGIRDQLNGYGIIIYGFKNGLKYTGQTKNSLKATFKIPSSYNEAVKQFMSNILSTKVVKKKEITVDKYQAANDSTKNVECSLILTEGDSAKTLFDRISEHCPTNFYDRHGIFALRGKVKNVNQYKNFIDIANDELKSLIEIIGFQAGVKYNKDNIRNLRYQHVIIATDYDDDGYHIKGLLLFFFIKFWPELIELGYFQQFTTPRILADNIEFYQDTDFDKLARHTHVQYLKGLGTINPKSQLFKNISQHFSNYLRDLTSDDIPKTKLLLANLFEDDSQPRKDMMNKFIYHSIDHSQTYISINTILDQQVLLYAQSSVYRAIPSFFDGLKESQRKIVYYLYKHQNAHFKVANLASAVSNSMDYKHGEVSLQDAIVKLAQDFPGTNNCNLLVPDGQFGSRWNPNSSASARYIYTQSSDYLKKFFNKEDEALFIYNISDDGEQIEPKFMLPIVPLFLINGALGIATGFSTNIPSFKLQDIIVYIKSYLLGYQTPTLQPSYKDYLGTTRIENGIFINTGYSKTNGQYTLIYDTVLSKYKEKLKEELEKLKIYPKRKGKEDYLEVKTTQLPKELFDKYMNESYKVSNMTLLMPTGHVDTYDSIYVLLNHWIDYRLYYYIKRKQHILQMLIRDFIIRFNYTQMEQQNIIDYYKQKDKFYNKLSYLTPYNKIESYYNFTDLNKLKEQLLLDMKNVQSTDMKQYKYLSDKSIDFYVQKDFKLDEIIKQFNSTQVLTETKMWINDLQQL